MSEDKDPMIPDGAVNPIDTDYKVGQDNILVNVGPFGLDIHNRVFAVSGLLVVAFVVLTLAFQNQVEPLFSGLRGWLTSNLDWFFIIAGNIFVLVCLGLAVSPLGKVRLGGTEATPDYSYLGWFSMLFAAGMGIGLMFFGVSEPLAHFGSAHDHGHSHDHDHGHAHGDHDHHPYPHADHPHGPVTLPRVPGKLARQSKQR